MMLKLSLTQRLPFFIKVERLKEKRMNKISIIVLITFILSPFQIAVSQEEKKASTPVFITQVKAKKFFDIIEALGTLRARESVELNSSVTEIVTKVYFQDNQRVKKGDVLLEMDTAEEVAELAEQKSFLEEAQRQVNRLIPLVKNRAASASLLDENRRELEGAKARVNAIQSRINQRIVKAPFDGVLGLRNISVGALAQPGSIVTTIDDDRVMKLDFSVPEVFLASLKTGIVISASSEAFPDKIFEGEVAHINSRIDSVTRSIQARAILSNEEGLLKPGLLMTVELQKNPRTTLLIPEEALLANGPDNFVFVVKQVNGKTTAEKRKVILGARQFGEVEIKSGLTDGEQIVTHGILRINDGDEVTIKAIDKGNQSLSELLEQASANVDKDAGAN